jgi:hypothetical protein
MNCALRWGLIGLLLTSAAFGQRRGVGLGVGVRVGAGGFRGVYSSNFRSGFGNVLFPAGLHPRYRGYGFGYFGGFWPGAYLGFSEAAPNIFEVGGYGGVPGPNVIYGGGPAVAPPPSVVINQTFVPEMARPVMRDYTMAPPPPPPEPEAEYRPTIYLIAFKDGSIQAALAYWVENRTLHYVTRANQHKQTSLDALDRALTDQLNRERGVGMPLPK